MQVLFSRYVGALKQGLENKPAKLLEGHQVILLFYLSTPCNPEPYVLLLMHDERFYTPDHCTTVAAQVNFEAVNAVKQSNLRRFDWETYLDKGEVRFTDAPLYDSPL